MMAKKTTTKTATTKITLMTTLSPCWGRKDPLNWDALVEPGTNSSAIESARANEFKRADSSKFPAPSDAEQVASNVAHFASFVSSLSFRAFETLDARQNLNGAARLGSHFKEM